MLKGGSKSITAVECNQFKMLNQLCEDLFTPLGNLGKFGVHDMD